MCVAVVMNPGSQLTPDEIFKMGNANGDGFGIAWAEEGVVNWWKTIVYDVDYLTHLVNSLAAYPRFVHFRLSTVGGVQVQLCHPFEIGPNAACQAQGHAHKVMMHNGHWYRAEEIFQILKKEGALPDNGPWSDTRIAALLASQDEDWLTTVTGRVATLDGDGNVKLLGSWDQLREGIKVSNKGWDHEYNYRRTGSSRHWPGWGWTEQNWKEKEAHDKEKAKKEQEEKEKQEKAEKEKEKEKKDGKKEKKGASNNHSPGGVGVGQGERQLLSGGDGRSVSGPSAGKEGEESEKPPIGETFFEEFYDYTPWQNPVTHEWWQVDPTKTRGSHYELRPLSDKRARAIIKAMEQTPTPSS